MPPFRVGLLVGGHYESNARGHRVRAT